MNGDKNTMRGTYSNKTTTNIHGVTYQILGLSDVDQIINEGHRTVGTDSHLHHLL